MIIWAWERRCVYRGPEKERYFRILEVFDREGIPYQTAIRDLERTKYLTVQIFIGTLGQDPPSYRYLFYIMVRKRDQERAEYWINRTV